MRRRDHLRALLVQAYWRADTSAELSAVRTIAVALSFGDPLFDGLSA